MVIRHEGLDNIQITGLTVAAQEQVRSGARLISEAVRAPESYQNI